MIRFLNVLAIVALIASATAAYSVKYETILVAEKLRKREAEVGKERDAIAVLQAEWQLLNRPARLQTYARPEFGLQPVSARQIAQASDVPMAKPEADKIDALLTGSLPSGDRSSKTSGKTPAMSGTQATTPKSQPNKELAALTSTSATPRAQTNVRPAANLKAPITPRSPKAPMAQTGTAPKTSAITRPMSLTPPAAIPNSSSEPPKASGGISSLIGKLMGR